MENTEWYSVHGGYLGEMQVKEPKPEMKVVVEGFQYPYTFEEWKEIFRVSSRYIEDTTLIENKRELLRQFEAQKKELAIKSSIKYTRILQNKELL